LHRFTRPRLGRPRDPASQPPGAGTASRRRGHIRLYAVQRNARELAD